MAKARPRKKKPATKKARAKPRPKARAKAAGAQADAEPGSAAPEAGGSGGAAHDPSAGESEDGVAAAGSAAGPPGVDGADGARGAGEETAAEQGGGRRRRRRPRGGRGRREAGAPPTRDLAGAARVARQRFKIERLHPLQEQAIEAVLAGRDAIAVLPTGYGKSLIYQVPAVMSDRPTIVVSPLIALMADQERSLRARGVPVVRIDSTVRVAARREALARLAEGGRLIVLTTPETLESKTTRPAFAAAKPWLLCIDEAHCISEWGHDFRPAYLRLGAERRSLGDPQLLALTATATPRVRDDAIERLHMRDPEVVLAPPHRENLRLEVELVTVGSKPARTGQLIKRLPRPGIVYCATTGDTESIWKALSKANIPCARYHGRMKQSEREEAQKRYMRPSKPRVMVATSAFGMGIDKADIRYILHYQAPGSLEQYVQESGRAGRDGKPSRCILLYDPADLDIQAHLQRQGRPTPGQLRKVGSALQAWAGEERPVAIADLALSAGVTQVITRSLCAQLEELGAVERDTESRYRVVVGPEELAENADDLARRMETQRREDEERLKIVDAYANTQECRSVFIRRYFGEEDPPECGRCDRCDPEGGRTRPARKRRGKRKKPQQRGRRRRGGKRQGAAKGGGASGANPEKGSNKKRRGKRRRRRKRRPGEAGKGGAE